jgi:hypothetical protein
MGALETDGREEEEDLNGIGMLCVGVRRTVDAEQILLERQSERGKRET